MAQLGQTKVEAKKLQAEGQHLAALRLFDAAVAAQPLDFGARMGVGDCLASLGENEAASRVYRAVGWYALRAGHPLATLVCARVAESLAGDFEDLLAALVVHYGSESELISKFAARINLPAADSDVAIPDLNAALPPTFAAEAAARAEGATEGFSEFPEALHAIPLLSQLSEDAFRRVLGTLLVKRMGHGQSVIREGEPGQSFFFVASGTVRVFDTDGLGRERDLAHLHENAVFGEMALLSNQPRSATVQVVGDCDLLEVTRGSLAALADELDPVATALHEFTRDRLLSNLMGRSPLFKPFSKPQQRDLLRRFTAHDVAPDTDIIIEGDEGRGLFVVLSGQVEVLKANTPLATLRTGDVFGEIALIRGGETTATVRAATPATVLFLGREYVERIVAGVPAIRQYLQSLTEDRELDTQLTMEPLPGDEEDDGSIIIMI